MNTRAFLQRIDFKQSVTIDLATLSQLQQQFLFNVPFENLSIQQQKPLDYRPSAVFNKVVERKQGGVCYELNSLFCDALQALGFKARIIAAQMWPDKKARADWDYNHMAVIVKLAGKEYLVDVGNGIYLGKPLAIAGGDYAECEGLRFHCEAYDDEHLVLLTEPLASIQDRSEQQVLVQRYVFKPKGAMREDFKPACHYVETSPDSVFVQKLVVTRWTEQGRITLSDNTFIETDLAQNRTETAVADTERNTLLKDKFALEL
ncbi:arylamine N-acetyltransferase [Agarivorans sp. Alg241-V36]|uniref:arylamine N-acetyltransferase family protein n=1 Tax=Agarivorans sp. Alg241-V36 TaxID=2305992 RepID=UPI0013D80053|nr:arylamine N-acetyltransferase [Agarivorans sp. Alg241-V36]